MPYGLVRILIFFILFSRRQGFRMITFDRFKLDRSRIGRSASFSDPARPPGGGVGQPKIPPPQFFIFFVCVSEPQEHF